MNAIAGQYNALFNSLEFPNHRCSYFFFKHFPVRNQLFNFTQLYSMRKIILTISNKHQVFLRYLLVLNTIILIVFMLPREAQFNYTYKIGKPWVYENIIAPFDFAINKSEE